MNVHNRSVGHMPISPDKLRESPFAWSVRPKPGMISHLISHSSRKGFFMSARQAMLGHEEYDKESIDIDGKKRKISTNVATGYKYVVSVGGRGRKTKYVHQLVAESALGKKLPNGACVHHIDGNRQNNNNDNLLICPNKQYHMLIHRRQRAFDSCGDANSVLCEYCGKYGADKERNNRPGSGWHYECKRKYERDAHARRKINV